MDAPIMRCSRVWRATCALLIVAASCTRGAVHSPSLAAVATPAAGGEPAPSAAAGAPDPSGAGCASAGSGRDFEVGPGRRYEAIGQVPLESLDAGDTVRIFWREQPYREKLMISAKGTASRPVRICGMAGPAGQLPVIDGQDATTRPQLDFPHEGHQPRGLVIIGHAHGDPWESTPTFIVLEGLEVRNAAPPNAFTDRAGKKTPYSPMAAGIFVERASHLVIRGCTVTANNNGIFAGTGGDETTLTKDVLIEGNYVHDNGSLADYYEHNVYNEASNVVYQYNRFGPPRGGKSGVLGANIKERSAGVVIRYNWIEDGAHILDIVDAQESREVTRPMASFHATYVYGNVIVRGRTPSGSMVHYGGDSGVLNDYRKGALFFYDNTVVVDDVGYPAYAGTSVFELSTNDEHLDSRNNVYFSAVQPDELHPVGMLGSRDRVSSGVATFAGDWVRKGWTEHDLTPGTKVELKGQAQGLDSVTRGDSPGFRDAGAQDYGLASPGAAGIPVALAPAVPAGLLPTSQYVKHQRGRPRLGSSSVGALGE